VVSSRSPLAEAELAANAPAEVAALAAKRWPLQAKVSPPLTRFAGDRRRPGRCWIAGRLQS
jgi:hypothetical protein